MSDENVNEEQVEAVADDAATPSDEAATTPADEATAAADMDASSSSDSSSDSDADEAANEVDLEALRAKVAAPPKDARYQATGKRKRSVARVIITPGDGTFWINGRTLEEYFPRNSHRTAILDPLVAAGAVGAYHVRARLHGGGITGQTGALRHGIAKALAEIDPALRTQLKGKGFLKVDTRQVERKKAGLKKARKRPQFSKR